MRGGRGWRMSWREKPSVRRPERGAGRGKRRLTGGPGRCSATRLMTCAAEGRASDRAGVGAGNGESERGEREDGLGRATQGDEGRSIKAENAVVCGSGVRGKEPGPRGERVAGD